MTWLNNYMSPVYVSVITYPRFNPNPCLTNPELISVQEAPGKHVVLAAIIITHHELHFR